MLPEVTELALAEVIPEAVGWDVAQLSCDVNRDAAPLGVCGGCDESKSLGFRLEGGGPYLDVEGTVSCRKSRSLFVSCCSASSESADWES